MNLQRVLGLTILILELTIVVLLMRTHTLTKQLTEFEARFTDYIKQVDKLHEAQTNWMVLKDQQ